jgi:hypothetical protein
MRLARLAERLRPRVEALDQAAAALIERAVAISREAEIQRPQWRGPGEVRRRALAALMAAVAGAAREPPASTIDALERRIAAPTYAGGTHGGVRFVPAPREVMRLTRDPGAVLGRGGGGPRAALPLPVGEEQVWDGRIAFTARVPGWSAVADDNPDLVALEKAGGRRRITQSDDAVSVRPLLQERLRHALGPAVNWRQGN